MACPTACMSRRQWRTARAQFKFIPRGTVDVKGAGLMETFCLEKKA